MREVISISAIIVAFIYFLAFGSAIFMALESQMHWALAFFTMAWIIILRIWPALPILAVIGAVHIWGWQWYQGIALGVPVSIYVVSYYWTRITDYFRRPMHKQGV